MKIYSIVPAVAMVAMSLVPAVAYADLYINSGRSLTGGPTMVRDPAFPLPDDCHRVNEDTTRCSVVARQEIGRIRFISVSNKDRYCFILVTIVAKPGTMNAAHWWNAHVINNGSVHCEAHWSNDNTVTIRAR